MKVFIKLLSLLLDKNLISNFKNLKIECLILLEILNKSKLDPDQQEAVSIIHNSSEILITLVNDILDFSKINSEKLALEKVPFNLQKTVKLVYDLLVKKAENKKIMLENKFDENIPQKIVGDKIRINQIIMKYFFVRNFFKFTNGQTDCWFTYRINQIFTILKHALLYKGTMQHNKR